MSILFTGYYGQQNTGDDAFCVISDWGAKKYWNQSRVDVLGRNLPQDSCGQDLYKSIPNKKYFRGQEYLELLTQGLRYSYIIFSGGSLFHTEITGFSKENIFNWYQKIGSISLGAIGVSLGPYKSLKARNSVKKFLSNFSFLALRDVRSYEEALDMDLNIPVVEAFDLAGLLPLISPVKKMGANSPILGVSICRYEQFINVDSKKEQQRFDKILACIDKLADKIGNLVVRIFVFNGHPVFGDMEISSLLKSKISKKAKVEIVHYTNDPISMWKSVSECGAVLSTRLHAGIFSFFSKTPFIQIEYHKKCSDFLSDISYADNFRIGDFDNSVHEVSLLLEDILNRTICPNINVVKFQEKARLNFTPFFKLVEA